MQSPRMTPKRPILRAMMNPYPQARVGVRYGSGGVPVSTLLEIAARTGTQPRTECKTYGGGAPHFEPQETCRLCLPMPTPNSPDAEACSDWGTATPTSLGFSGSSPVLPSRNSIFGRLANRMMGRR